MKFYLTNSVNIDCKTLKLHHRRVRDILPKKTSTIVTYSKLCVFKNYIFISADGLFELFVFQSPMILLHEMRRIF